MALAVAGAAYLLQRDPEAPSGCRTVRFEDSPFTVCTANASAHDIALVRLDAAGVPYQDLGQLSQRLPNAQRVAFAMNAGMYGEAGAPIGLYVEDGAELQALNTNEGPGNFHLMPNGVFWVDTAGGGHVTESSAFAAASVSPRFASQSGPMLVIDGALHPEIQSDGPSRYVRNGVGECEQGTVFVISEDLVSFGRFARLFRDELDCDQALYFDGSVSSLWIPGRRLDEGHDLGPLVVVSRKAQPLNPVATR